MTENNKMQLFKARDFGDQITAVFDFIKLNFAIIGKTYLFFAFPFILIGTILYLYGFQMVIDGLRSYYNGGASNPLTMGANLLLLIGNIIFTLSVYSIMKLYNQMDDPREMRPQMVWDEMTKYIGKYIGASFLVGIFMILGFLLFLIPGIYVTVAMSLTTVMIVFEDRSVGNAIDGSMKLIKGYWWSTFGYFIVVAIIYWVLSYTIVLPLTLLSPFSPIDIIINPQSLASVNLLSVTNILSTILSNGIQYFLYAIIGVAAGIRYFTLRELKEGISLDEEIEAMTEGLKDD